MYGVLANPGMRPAMYMHSQQQGSFHHAHLQPTAAAAGIIRPVPQHAQPQTNRVCVLLSFLLKMSEFGLRTIGFVSVYVFDKCGG